MSVRLEIRSLMVVSTAHLTEKTAQWLSDQTNYQLAHQHIPSLNCGQSTYGFEVHVPIEEYDEQWPKELEALFQLARQNMISMISFDCDGPTIEGYPTYDW